MISITIFIIQLKSCIKRSVSFSAGIHTRWRDYSPVGEIWWCHVTRCLRLDPSQSITDYVIIKHRKIPNTIWLYCFSHRYGVKYNLYISYFFLLFLYFSLFSKQDLQVFCCKLKCSFTPSLQMYVWVRENSLVSRKEDQQARFHVHHLRISVDFVFCNINLL